MKMEEYEYRELQEMIRLEELKRKKQILSKIDFVTLGGIRANSIISKTGGKMGKILSG